jgi:phytoene dehydrogenase-like protein
MTMGQGKADAIIVGSGPNGLCAAIELARAGWSVRVYERNSTIGGGARSAELTLPGFTHDLCSTIYAVTLWSPMMRSLPLADHGVQWVQPPAALAHPFDDAPAAVVHRSFDQTSQELGADGPAYRNLLAPFLPRWTALGEDLLAPLQWPGHPVLMGRFGHLAIRSAAALATQWFTTSRGRALVAGMAGHSMLPLEKAGTAAFALVLMGCAHSGGWPFARGGARSVAEALASILRSLGGEILTDRPVKSLDDLPRARGILLDVTPKQFLAMAGDRLTECRRRRWEKFRYGPGAFKVDFALAGPIPWKDQACLRAGTVHLGGTFEEIAASEADACAGRLSDRPFVILTQPTLFDPTRAPPDRHVAWAYCHVPHGSSADQSAALEGQIERFAPGFKDLILDRRISGPIQLEAENPNLVGGDINGGAQDLPQLWRRPVSIRRPYATPIDGVWLCSASTPPGGGVHGMCGHWAARQAINAPARSRP